MAKEEEAEEPKEAAPKPKGKGKLIIIIVAVVVLLGGGAGAFLFLGGSKEKKEEEQGEDKKAEEKHYLTGELDPFIVNLRAANTFLKVTILLEYDPLVLEKGGTAHGSAGGGFVRGGGGSGGEGGKGGLPAPFQARMPMIKDAIIRVLSSKTAEEVLSPEGKETLKEELVETINEALGLEEPAVVGLYFNEFILQ